jgi:signal transduction histidine kinase
MLQEKHENFLFNFFLGKHQFKKNEYILKYKIMTLSIIISVMFVGINIIGFVRYLDGNITQAIIDVGMAFSFLIAAVILRFNKNSFVPISRALLLVALIGASLQLIWYPDSESRIIWFSTTVYVGFFLLDRREGWFWMFAIVSGLIGMYLFDPDVIALTFLEFVTFILNLILISILLNWYEKIKEESYETHNRHRLELEDTILEKTLELQKLNATLHHRVDEEMDKNRDKDKQMIHQSRLAQMGEMISMIAHQWRQPLAAISATATALQLRIARKRYDEESFLQNIKQINEYSQHLSSTIDDFRNFFSANKEQTLFSLKESVEGSLKIIGTSLNNHNIKVTIESVEENQIFSYPNEVRQVILNILKNAEDILIEKAIENPRIHIRISPLGPMLILEIGDNAGGVPQEIKERIFDPYFTTKEKRDGTGLGLYMSKTIIEDHCGGKLSVYNSKHGAVFEISFRQKREED